MDERRAATPERRGPTITAVAYSLTPSESHGPISIEDLDIGHLSNQLQFLGHDLNWAEMAASVEGIFPRGALAEIYGRLAAAGEQLTLALAATRDAEEWAAVEDSPARSLVGRAMTDTAAFYAVAVAHVLVNATVRLFDASPAGRERLGQDQRLQKTSPDGFLGFEPFGRYQRELELSLNKDSGKLLDDVAHTAGLRHGKKIVAALRSLVGSAAWQKVVDQRDIAHHRWRPQSFAGGASQTDPWGEEEDGTPSLTFFERSTHTPPDPSQLARDARAALRDLVKTVSVFALELDPLLAELGHSRPSGLSEAAHADPTTRGDEVDRRAM